MRHSREKCGKFEATKLLPNSLEQKCNNVSNVTIILYSPPLGLYKCGVGIVEPRYGTQHWACPERGISAATTI
jgi:hypothetical protein